MSRPCSACRHPMLDEISAELTLEREAFDAQCLDAEGSKG